MDVVTWLSFGAVCSLVTLLMGCLKCRRKMTEEESQQKEFEKFRKRHMHGKDHVLSKRVDYVRRVSEDKSGSLGSGSSENIYEPMTTPHLVHPPMIIQVLDPSPQCSSDHSFFDDSFQTVIEASSSNMTGVSHGVSNFLTVPASIQASYISLQNSSQLFLANENSASASESSVQGETNLGYSDSLHNLTSSCNASDSSESLNNSYVVPTRGPKIRVTQPSIRRELDSTCITHIQTDMLNTQTSVNHEQTSIQLPVRNVRKSSLRMKTQNSISSFIGLFNKTNSKPGNRSSLQENAESSDELGKKNLQKLELEGPVHNEPRLSQGPVHNERRLPQGPVHNEQRYSQGPVRNERRLSQGPIENDSKLSIESIERWRRLSEGSGKYESLKSSRYSDYLYKSLSKTALVLPGRPRLCSPLMSKVGTTDITPLKSRLESLKNSSTQSEHTYESINSVIIGDINRRSSVASVDSCEGNASKEMNLSRERMLYTPALRGSYTDEENNQNNLSLSPHHTYESIKSIANPASSNKQASFDCDNSAIIIGRRVSNPFDQSKLTSRLANKKKQRHLKEIQKQSSKEKKSPTDGETRYSPFPGSKKLAFKSAFKQAASPKFCMVQTVTGKMKSHLFPNPENPDVCLDNLNIRTPEIKVENSAQCFDDNTAFVSPSAINGNDILNHITPQKNLANNISPLCTYQTLKDCMNLKVNSLNMQTSLVDKPSNYHKKALPSLADNLEEELLKHCNLNLYAKSTPFELEKPIVSHFF